MADPSIDLIPLKLAIRKGCETDLFVMIRIATPSPTTVPNRPALNLGLVLDRSGSMAGGGKLRQAIRAASFAVEQLLPTDRVSVTTFDDQVETIVPNQPAAAKATILARLASVEPGGTTALHAGWAEGVSQVERHLTRGGLNRVMLLSDGLANQGLSAPQVIAAEVTAAKGRGVGTTTLGVGDDYNEDLMQAMAQAGDGNYYFIDDARQLPDIFQTEMHGLMATLGTDATLRLDPQNGVVVSDVLNDLARVEGGPYRLPNLVAGNTIDVVARLTVPPGEGVTELLRARAEWTAAGAGGRQGVARSLILPTVDPDEWTRLPDHSEVAERAGVLASNRLKVEASDAMMRGDHSFSAKMLYKSKMVLDHLPLTATVEFEIGELERLRNDLEQDNAARMRKRARANHYYSGHSRPQSPPPPPPPPPDRGTETTI